MATSLLEHRLNELQEQVDEAQQTTNETLRYLKKKVGSGQGQNVKVDSEFSLESENPLMNRIITELFIFR